MSVRGVSILRHIPSGAIGALVAAALFSGCGKDAAPSRGDRPALGVTVTAAILDEEVTLSPRSVGAGLVRVVLTNLTRTTREVTLTTADGGREKTGPVDANDTATLAATLPPGTYELTARGNGRTLRAALRVGTARPSSNDELLTP